MYACSAQHGFGKQWPGSVEILLRCGADPEVTHDENGYTALMMAAQGGNSGAVNELLKAKANIEARDVHGHTPLMIAVKTSVKRGQRTNEDISQVLLCAGSNIDAQDNEGYTSLMWACMEGNESAVMFLIGVGADKNLKNKYGKMALDYARSNGYQEIVGHLLADPGKTDEPRGGNPSMEGVGV